MTSTRCALFFGNTISPKGDAYHRFSALIFVVLAMLSFLIKPAMAYYYRPYFSYMNGSDEHLYLTYQGAISMLDGRARYVSSYVVKALHEIGLSGSVINLIFDMATPLLMLVVVALTVRRLWGEVHALIAGWIIVFCPVLFNQSNPLLEGLLPDYRKEHTFWVSAWEGFAPYIRTPEPQFSYLFIIIALLIYLLLHRRIYVLFLPIPLLYDSVLLGYVFVLGVVCLLAINGATLKIRQDSRVVVAACVMVTIALAFSFRLADELGLFNSWAALPTHYRHTHSPALSINLLFCVACWLLVQALGRTSRPQSLDAAALIAIFLQIFIVNQQVISGVSIFPQGLQSTSGTAASAFTLYYLVSSLFDGSRFAALSIFYLISILAIVSINNAQGLQLENNRYRIDVGHNINAGDLAELRSHPFGYIGATQFLKAYIGLAYPKQLLPLFSHQYFFPFFMGICQPQIDLHKKGIAFLQANLDNENLAPYRKQILDEVAAAENAIALQPEELPKTCPFEVPEEPAFRIVPTPDDVMFYIQFEPPAILQQGIDF